MPNQFAYSKAFFDRWYRPEYATVIVAGDVDPAKVLPLVEKYWGAWKRGTLQASRSRRSRAPTGPTYGPRPLDDADAPLGRRLLPRPRLLRRPRRTARPSTSSSTSPSARPPTLYKKLVETEQKVDQLFPYLPPAPTRSSSRSARASRSSRTPSPSATRSSGPSPALRTEPVAGPPPRRRQVERPLRPRRGASTTPRRSPARSPASSATAASTARSTSSSASTTR